MKYHEILTEIKKRAERLEPLVLRDGVKMQLQILDDALADYAGYRNPSPFIRGFVYGCVVNVNMLACGAVMRRPELWIDCGALLSEIDAQRKEAKEA